LPSVKVLEKCLIERLKIEQNDYEYYEKEKIKERKKLLQQIILAMAF